MNKRSYLVGFFILLMVGAVGLTGCAVPGHVTGGGTIESANNPSKSANFGFNANTCGPREEVFGHFNFVDKYTDFSGGVKANGWVIEAAECVPFGGQADAGCGVCRKWVFLNSWPDDAEGVYVMKLLYDSTNPKLRGDGYAWVCVADFGEGANATTSDMLGIYFETGPYAGYFNKGETAGNIQSHECSD